MIDTRIHVNDGSVTIQRVQDVEPILEEAKARQSAGLVGTADYWHMASLPAVLVEKYCNVHGITFAEFMANDDHVRAMVNDPALAHFRIHAGRM